MKLAFYVDTINDIQIYLDVFWHEGHGNFETPEYEGCSGCNMLDDKPYWANHYCDVNLCKIQSIMDAGEWYLSEEEVKEILKFINKIDEVKKEVEFKPYDYFIWDTDDKLLILVTNGDEYEFR